MWEVLVRYKSSIQYPGGRVKILIHSSSRNTRDCSREIRAQSETRLHREYNLAMKNKSLSCTMLHWSIVTHAQARRIAAAQRIRCFAPCAAQQERDASLKKRWGIPVHGSSFMESRAPDLEISEEVQQV